MSLIDFLLIVCCVLLFTLVIGHLVKIFINAYNFSIDLSQYIKGRK